MPQETAQKSAIDTFNQTYDYKANQPVAANVQASAAADGSEIDTSKLIILDLSQLRKDLASSSKFVRNALDAEKAMYDTAASAGVDLNKPEDAAVAMKKVLGEQDQTNLKNGMNTLEQGRIAVVNILQQIQTTTNELETAVKKQQSLSGPLPDEFWTDLDKKTLADAGKEAGSLWDFVNQFTAALADADKLVVSVIHGVAGSDVVKDWIKGQTDDTEVLKDKIAQLGVAYNQVIRVVAKATAEEIMNLKLSLERLGKASSDANALYCKELGDYAKLVSKLSGKAGSPKFTKTYFAIVTAHQLSKNARSALVTKWLGPEKKFKICWNQFHPLGELILDAPDTGKPGAWVGDMIVYAKGDGRQYAYREKSQTLNDLVQQLEPVKRVYDASRSLDQLFDSWDNAMSN